MQDRKTEPKGAVLPIEVTSQASYGHKKGEIQGSFWLALRADIDIRHKGRRTAIRCNLNEGPSCGTKGALAALASTAGFSTSGQPNY